MMERAIATVNGKVLFIWMALAIICLTTRAWAENALSLSLEEACKMGLRHSAELRAARYSILSGKRLASLALWKYAPTLDLSLADSRTTRYNAKDTDIITAAASLCVPVSRGGRRKITRDLGMLSLNLQSLLVSESEDRIRDACFQAFFGTHLLLLEVDALREQESITASQCEIAQREYELGQITEMAMVETRLKNSIASQSLFSAETELHSYEYSLKKLTGLDPGTRITLETGIDSTYAGLNLELAVERLRDSALEGNTSIIQGRFDIEEQRIKNRLSDSSWRPDIDLEASVQLSGERYPLQRPAYGLRAKIGFPFTFMPVTLSFGISTNPGIEYGRSLSSGTQTSDSLDFIVDGQMSRIALMQAVEACSSLTEDIMFQLDQAILDYERLRMEQRLIQESLRLQERKVSILSVQLDLGQVTRIEYLEGEQDLLGSRLELLSGIRSLMEGERRIESLSGLRAGELAKYGGTDGS